MDIAHAAPAWRSYLESRGMRPQRPFTRMYLGKRPAPPPAAELYAVAGPEWG